MNPQKMGVFNFFLQCHMFWGKFKKLIQNFILLTKSYFQTSKKHKIITYSTIVLHTGLFSS